jgi:hypothetical protein
VESEQLEGYIQRMYAATREFVVAHPLGGGTGEDDDADEG